MKLVTQYEEILKIYIKIFYMFKETSSTNSILAPSLVMAKHF